MKNRLIILFIFGAIFFVLWLCVYFDSAVSNNYYYKSEIGILKTIDSLKQLKYIKAEVDNRNLRIDVSNYRKEINILKQKQLCIP